VAGIKKGTKLVPDDQRKEKSYHLRLTKAQARYVERMAATKNTTSVVVIRDLIEESMGKK